MEKAILIDHNSKKNRSLLNQYNRIYIGSEFCQYLLPTIEELKKIIIKSKNKELSFITPIVNDIGLQRVDRILNFLSKEINKKIEIIFNDFGVLNLIHAKYPNFDPVIGRIISQQFITLDVNCSVRNSTSLKSLIEKYKINRIEIDTKGENTSIDIPKEIKDLKVSLYFPFMLISTTKRCIFPHLLSKQNEVFENYQCNQECLKTKHCFTMRYPMIKEKVFLNRNAHFIKKNLPKKIEQTNIDRIVYDDIYGK